MRFMRLKKPEFWLAGVALIFITLTMYYADITVTARYSLCFIDSLFDGELFSFYNNAMAAGIAPEGAVYDIGMYIIFAIWNFPVWMLAKITDINVLGVFPLLWFKALLVVFTYGTLRLLKKIALYIGLDGFIGHLEYIYILSPLVVFPVLVVAQYDVIPLFFILYGVCGWLEKDKVKWIVSFSLSFIMKPFSILLFAVSLLMEEKKLLRIFTTGVVSVIPFVSCKLAYGLSPHSCVSNDDFFKQMFPKLMKISFQIGSGEVSVFFLVLILLYIVAYIHVPEDDIIVKGRQFIWYAFLLWSAFCMFTEVAPYWIIYLMPFLALIVFYNVSIINFTLILDLVINAGIIFLMIIQYPWVYGGQKTFSYLFLKNIYGKAGGEERISTVAGLLRAVNLSQFFPVVSAVVLGALIACGFYSYSGIRNYKNQDKKITIDSWHIRARILFLYAWVGICLMLLLFNLG